MAPSALEYFVAAVDVLILIGVWLELYMMLQKRRRAQIKRFVSLTLGRLGIRVGS